MQSPSSKESDSREHSGSGQTKCRGLAGRTVRPRAGGRGRGAGPGSAATVRAGPGGRLARAAAGSTARAGRASGRRARRCSSGDVRDRSPLSGGVRRRLALLVRQEVDGTGGRELDERGHAGKVARARVGGRGRSKRSGGVVLNVDDESVLAVVRDERELLLHTLAVRLEERRDLAVRVGEVVAAGVRLDFGLEVVDCNWE
jgi:hypothetical protein